jgi:DNA repair exonuclease SbcCD ATPase subunit
MMINTGGIEQATIEQLQQRIAELDRLLCEYKNAECKALKDVERLDAALAEIIEYCGDNDEDIADIARTAREGG